MTRAGLFNAGVIIGLASTSAGVWLAFGLGPALIVFGLLVWLGTIAATALAVALRKMKGD